MKKSNFLRSKRFYMYSFMQKRNKPRKCRFAEMHPLRFLLVNSADARTLYGNILSGVMIIPRQPSSVYLLSVDMRTPFYFQKMNI